jgi:arylsulfatase
MSHRPNVLFILADQHNAKVLGHQGHPDVQTPHLDRMAAEGVRCDTAISQNPICTPSRMCFLSGQYAHNHGHYGLSGPNPPGLPSLLGHFRQAGYRTAAVGKIHCPEYWIEDDADLFHDTCGSSIDGRSKAYEQFLRERGKLELEDHIGLPEFGARGRQSMEGRPSPLTFEESQEGWITAQTIAFMQENAAAGRPFFAHASLPRPHQCTAPSEPFWSMYEGRELTLPPNADYDLVAARKAPHLIRAAANWRTGNWACFEPKTFEAARLRKLRGYLGAVSQVDHAVGRLLDFLRASGLAENTVVVYSADHGDYACEHGIMEKAPGICHDAITRIPFIWWAPGRLPAGYTIREIVESVDVAPTLCAQTGVAPLCTADGADLSALLRGETGTAHRVGVTEFAWGKSLRKGDFRLVFYPRDMFPQDYPDGFGELYNLADDPWEMRNLFFDPAHRATVTELTGELLDWLVTTTRPVTVHGVSSQPRPDTPQAMARYKTWSYRDGKIGPADIRPHAGGNYV